MIQLRNINTATPEEIQKLANNHAIAVNLRDAFPYPYTVEDAVTYLELAANIKSSIMKEGKIIDEHLYSIRKQ